MPNPACPCGDPNGCPVCGRVKRKRKKPTEPRFLYGVFAGSRWGITTELTLVRQFAEANPAAEVRYMKYPGETGGWDSPTFYSLSEPLPADWNE